MIRVQVHGDRTRRFLTNAQKQVRFAAAVALTRAAKAVEKDLQHEVASALDKPTPWIRKGTFSTAARKDKLEAVVGIKDRQGLYLKEHFAGGQRGQKPFERALSGMGLLPQGMKAVPGPGLKLDANGNPNRTQLKEVFGSLKSGMGVAKGRGKKMAVGVYVHVRAGNRAGLAPGVYYRAQRKIVPVLMFVSAAGYRKRIDLEKLAMKVVGKEFDRLFESAYAQAMASAR